jgi:ribosomal protein L11 methyltransferase
LGKRWPALDVFGDGQDEQRGFYLADDYGPTAVQEIDGGLRFFFSSSTDRDCAAEMLEPHLRVSPVDVPDDDWAQRSQEDLSPISVGRIIVTPPWHAGPVPRATSHEPRAASPISITIQPSMGFGTGHHATTRLCLAALQAIDLKGASVIDFGTGSGVLAMAAVYLGAAHALCVDHDGDAVRAAMENLARNPGLPSGSLMFVVSDLTTMEVPPADVVLANLTGGLLIRAAGRLRRAVKSGGLLIMSGFETTERNEVSQAFEGFRLVAEADEGGWSTITAQDRSKETRG